MQKPVCLLFMCLFSKQEQQCGFSCAVLLFFYFMFFLDYFSLGGCGDAAEMGLLSSRQHEQPPYGGCS